MTVPRNRVAPAFILLAGLYGCSSPTTPTTPGAASAPVSGPRNVFGVVINASGACLAGAVVEVIAGQAVGQKSAQSGPCDAWWPFNGFAFSNLTPGVSLTLRATAPGHATKDVTVKPDLQPVEVVMEPVAR
jgi:hypothetical protein